MYNKRNQGAFYQRYSNYMNTPSLGGNDRDDVVTDTPLSDSGDLLKKPSGSNPVYTVTVHYNGLMGNVSGNGLQLVDGGGSQGLGKITARGGDTVTLTATPKSGHRFVEWLGAPKNKKSNPDLALKVGANYNITAVFASDTPNPGGGGNGGSDDPETPEAPDPVVPSGKSGGVKSVLRKYWWVLAILAGYWLYKEGEL